MAGKTAFITTYADKTYTYTTTVRHKGTVIAFAMDNQRRIYYSILDLSNPNAKLTDGDNWLKDPKLLPLPNEIVQVGFGGYDLTMLPVVKKNGDVVTDVASIRAEEKDEFRSSTARLTANAPFQVLSDGNYLYVFRQAIAAGDASNVIKAGSSPLVDSTLLLDRFILVGTELQSKLEVRYQRSRKQIPQSRKDSLGTQDMEGKPFYEPTQELDFIRNLTQGWFAIVLLPTSIPELKRWQIFAYNAKTAMIDAWNIEQSKDGLFNTKGTQFYTCPNHADVFERSPGQCSIDGTDLIPIASTVRSAESAVAFDGRTSFLELPNRLESDTGTIELWLKFDSLDDQIILDASTSTRAAQNAADVVKYWFIDIKQKKLRFWLEDSQDADFKGAIAELSTLDDDWHHVAAVWNYSSDPARPGSATRLYLDGKLVGEDRKPAGKRPILQNPFIGKIRNDSPLGQGDKSVAAFRGQLDEVRLWSVARPQEAIAAGRSFRLQGNEPGLAGYWRLDEGSGAIAHDQTSSAQHGTLHGNVQWVKSGAAVGEGSEMLKTSFQFAGRSLNGGLSALLYFQQENSATGYDSDSKPLKRSARVMLVAAIGASTSATTASEIAAIDFGVSREGKLAQTPNVVPVKPISQAHFSLRPLEETLAEIAVLDSKLRSLPAVTHLQAALAMRTGRVKRFRGGTLLGSTEIPIGTTKAEGEWALNDVTWLAEFSIDPGLKLTIFGDNGWTEVSNGLPPLQILGWRSTYPYVISSTQTVSADLLDKTQSELQTLLTTAQNTQAELDRLKAIAQGDVKLPMPLLSLDASGLTTTGAVLDFALTRATPRLFDNANGNLILYFRGEKDQLLVAYYDTLTDRSTFTVESPEGSILLVARAAGSHMDDATVAIAGTGDTCTITLESVALGIKEVWNNVPRESDKLVSVLNGMAGRDPQDAFYYDYAQASISGKPGSDPANGSLLFVALSSDVRYQVQNATLQQETGKTTSAQWYANPPGNALEFDGVNDCVTLKADQSPAQFAVEGDLTLEAWVKPTVTSDHSFRRIITQKSDRSDYTMGLRPLGDDGFSAIALDSPDSIELSDLLDLPKDFTIEFWAYAVAGSNPPLSTVLSVDNGQEWDFIQLSNDRFYLGGSTIELYAPVNAADGTWHHWAFVRDSQRQERMIYCDGQQVAADPLITPPQEKAKVTLGASLGSDSFKGAIDELRIWKVARSERQINEQMNQLLSGNQKGTLTGCWRFEKGVFQDYSGNRHNVTQFNTPPKATQSAVTRYNLLVGVGSKVLESTKPISANDWTHVAAVYNQAYGLKFDGNDDALDCGKNTTLDISRDVTIEVFLQVDALGQRRGILSKGILDDGTGQNVPYALYVDADGKIVFTFEDTDNGNREFISDGAIAAGQMYRIAVTRQHSVDTTATPPTQKHNIYFFIGSRIGNTSSYAIAESGCREYPIDETHKDIGSSNLPLEIGKAYLDGAIATFFQGTISEVRIWSEALAASNVCSDIKGHERGLVAWWRFEENQGAIAYDSKSTNHATRSGATWVADPLGSSIVLYCNGEPISLKPSSVAAARPQFSLGALISAGSGENSIQEVFSGCLEEVRIWKVARSPEQIQDNLFRRLLGEQEDLIANYTFDAETTGELKDYSFLGNHLSLGTGDSQPKYVYSTAPISDEIPQVRNALLGIRTPFHDVVHSSVEAQEYGDLQIDEEGNLNGILKRCYCFIQNGAWQLVTGFKVGNLIAEWVSQVQTAPQIKGFIEGAPPVPSENLTDPDQDYNGATSIELTEAESTMHTYAASRDKGFDMSVEASAALGLQSETDAGGFGLSSNVEKTESKVGIKTTFENSLGWLDDASVGAGNQTSKTSALSLQGTWENQPTVAAIGRRFVPRNIGMALVQSETADVFALRLKHNRALVSYQMRPNPDIPKDWNILTFPINPRYVKQGTLDGRIGFENDRNYPNAGGITSDSSYFKPIEAYALKNRITRQEESLKAYFAQFEAGAIGRKQGSTGIDGGDLSKGRMAGKLPQFAKRNLVNTYVWTADGGLFTESEQTMDVRQEMTGGSYSFIGKAGVFADIGVMVAKVAVFFEMEAMFGGHLNLTVTKTEDSETSFGLAVNLDGIERDIYERNRDGQLIMEGDEYNPEPKKKEGKVDAYRFMSFYLQPDVEHFDEFANKVVDSSWLKQSNHPNAIALREAVQNQAQTKSSPWRVLHRVTYRSRVLPKEQPQTATPLEKAMIGLDIGSNWQLIKLLEPFVKNKTSVDFNDAVREAIATYQPELKPHTAEIIQSMRQYFQVPEGDGIV